jgi:arginyl-tRNA synthetase
MKEKIISSLKKATRLPLKEIEKLIEIPPNPDLGDYAFPCFILSKKLRKGPNLIAESLSSMITLEKEYEKIEAKGPYVNFFINPIFLAESTLNAIQKQKDKFGSANNGKGKKIIIEMSSPNIAKPFGIGHLRSTIIGNSISNISSHLNYKPIKINYLGDWGTQFGKLVVGYKKFGSSTKLKKDPIKHLLELYVKVSKDDNLEQEARDAFKKLESNDKETKKLWGQFRKLSLKEFDKIYSLLDVQFDSYEGESNQSAKSIKEIISKLKTKKLLKESEGAQIVNLEKYNLGVSVIKKSDSTTLYITRDLAAAISRHKKYDFSNMFYEVGSEQKLYFKQLFKILELMGYKWAKDCIHIDHGLYLDEDGKKFATRKGKTVFMESVLEETIELAKKEINKRSKLNKNELEERAIAIARAAIFYGDLKNYRSHDAIFDIDKFLSFEGNTGPYLLYTYARAKSILKKAKPSTSNTIINYLSPKEKQLITQLSNFPSIVQQSYKNLAPNIIANYTYQLAQSFNEFYHSEKVIGAESEKFKLSLVSATAQVLKNGLSLLGIKTLEKM